MPEYLGANFHMCLYDIIQARRTAMLLSSNVAKLEKNTNTTEDQAKYCVEYNTNVETVYGSIQKTKRALFSISSYFRPHWFHIHINKTQVNSSCSLIQAVNSAFRGVVNRLERREDKTTPHSQISLEDKRILSLDNPKCLLKEFQCFIQLQLGQRGKKGE